MPDAMVRFVAQPMQLTDPLRFQPHTRPVLDCASSTDAAAAQLQPPALSPAATHDGFIPLPYMTLIRALQTPAVCPFSFLAGQPSQGFGGCWALHRRCFPPLLSLSRLSTDSSCALRWPCVSAGALWGTIILALGTFARARTLGSCLPVVQ
jgi:hypothetical protein